MNWWKALKAKIKCDIPLARYTTFRIGGPARFFVEPRDRAKLQLVVRAAKMQKLPIFVLGAGSNVLVADAGVPGITIRLSSNDFKKFEIQGNRVRVGSGLPLGLLVKRSAQEGLSGFEFLAGIPGTVGGALAMNAGAWGKSMSELVEKVEIMDYNGFVKALARPALRFSYRSSSLSRYIILSAELKCSKSSTRETRNKITAFLKDRRVSQEQQYPNAGCIFKNPRGKSAGKLIESCGLKGEAVGGAVVSLQHANFIINRGNAEAKEVAQLMQVIQKRVKQKFGVSLKPEIKLWK